MIQKRQFIRIYGEIRKNRFHCGKPNKTDLDALSCLPQHDSTLRSQAMKGGELYGERGPMNRIKIRPGYITGYPPGGIGSPYNKNDSHKIPIIFIPGIFFTISAIHGYRKIKAKA